MEIDTISGGGGNIKRTSSSTFAPAPTSLSEFNVEMIIVHSQVPQHQVLTTMIEEGAAVLVDVLEVKRGMTKHNAMMRVIVNQCSTATKTNHSFRNAKNSLVANASASNAR